MYAEGYVTFDGIECVYIISADKIKLIPKNPDDMRKLNRHLDDHDIFFQYSDPLDKNQVAYIERVEMSMGHSLSLIPKYSVNLLMKAPISALEITGPAIDEFFSPAGYFYYKHVSGDKSSVDLTRETEIAENWEITVEGIMVSITLLYGGILRRGIASDLMLHPMLRAVFPPIVAPDFYYKIYSILTRFLQIVQYNSDLRRHKVYLCGTAPEHNSGYLHDWKACNKENSRFYTESEYRYCKPYIQKLLQFSADNLNMSFEFLPISQYRYRCSDYSPALLTMLFAAFESEYRANSKIYDLPNDTNIDCIKARILQKISECDTSELTKNEKTFLGQAEDRVNNLGCQAGQTRKIKNVCRVIEPVIKKSAEHLFIRSRLGTSDGFTIKEINQISEKIVALRAQAAHEHSLLSFDDEQAEYVHFLEILVYAQILKRAGIDDVGIELLIGVVFHCNFVFMGGPAK